jgi:hypothetical protein
LVCPSPCLARDWGPSDPRTAALLLYGTWAPRSDWFQAIGADAHWGYGIGFQKALSKQWALQLDGSRFAEPGRSTSPFGLGLVYGSDPSGWIRPWVEAGIGYYRFTGPGLGNRALSSAGNPRDQFVIGSSTGTITTDRWGGYFGIGADLKVGSRYGMFTGVRADNWRHDGIVRLRTGLSLDF